MSVTHASGSATETRKDFGSTVGDLSTQAKDGAVDLAGQTKDVVRRRPVPLVTAAAAGVATVVVAVVAVVRRRKANRTPAQRAMNAWLRTSKSVRKRVKR
ncbi:hypothetical protein [Dactylosporangium matsuzakiense]|uniref:Uncharacterized protein n=1 Tax=Dactylosporangium matsuzakiense TaxID=53360 RepID=A0A9W6KST8_9ACTN|nr:hypothetical protein [Dactylosporangium matsuzakiense]UWZ43416.1 hypothetical protein Dmats_39090 [Dactylosporangium matsuzakiense]GLL05871.1 hypothetical protein GCM10017581_076190 [Dactylosporangium matsuzakiense]